jgi:hypothetical protein
VRPQRARLLRCLTVGRGHRTSCGRATRGLDPGLLIQLPNRGRSISKPPARALGGRYVADQERLPLFDGLGCGTDRNEDHGPAGVGAIAVVARSQWRGTGK